jgi:hypothetical protein
MQDRSVSTHYTIVVTVHCKRGQSDPVASRFDYQPVYHQRDPHEHYAAGLLPGTLAPVAPVE